MTEQLITIEQVHLRQEPLRIDGSGSMISVPFAEVGDSEIYVASCTPERPGIEHSNRATLFKGRIREGMRLVYGPVVDLTAADKGELSFLDGDNGLWMGPYISTERRGYE